MRTVPADSPRVASRCKRTTPVGPTHETVGPSQSSSQPKSGGRNDSTQSQDGKSYRLSDLVPKDSETVFSPGLAAQSAIVTSLVREGERSTVARMSDPESNRIQSRAPLSRPNVNRCLGTRRCRSAPPALSFCPLGRSETANSTRPTLIRAGSGIREPNAPPRGGIVAETHLERSFV